jgi:hypothetical protein
MTSRREFLKAGLVATALPVAARADFAKPAPTGPLYKVLYDTRFPASIEFARRAEERGLAVHAMAGDMTRFWYDDLYHRWRQDPAPIAGLTAYGALFCLERLAWDQRMRVVYRGEHVAASGCVSHRFEGPGSWLSAAVEATAESDWPAALADVVVECPHGRGATTTTRVSPSSLAAGASSAETLFSWVIAPAARG